MAYSGSQITRLGLAGIPRGLYGSFAGKTEATSFTVYGVPGIYNLVTPTAGVYNIATPAPGIYEITTPEAGVYDL